MGKSIDIKKEILNKISSNNVIDRQFKELIKKETINVVEDKETIPYFFDLYEKLFYNIPKEGDQSHTTIINRSSEYLNISKDNIDVQLLLDEITNLREELLSANETISYINSIK